MARQISSILDFYDLESPYVTEYRRLLHRILKRSSQQELKSIMVTSAMTGEGKSTISAFLAVTASAKKGLKTLIVDADLRLPSVHKLFGFDRAPGLVEVLVDGLNPKDAIRKTKIDSLDVLTSGRRSDSPTEVFDAEAIGNLVNDMKFYYDLILVDCAPLLPVSDPMLLASKIDSSLLVVKAGATQRELVERALGIIDPAQNKVLGVVLNNMNHSLPYYFDYDYYQYDYRQSSDGKAGATTELEKRADKKNRTVAKSDTVEKDIKQQS